MAKSPENSTLEEILGKYQRSLRGELRRTSAWAGAAQVRFLTPRFSPRQDTEEEDGWCCEP